MRIPRRNLIILSILTLLNVAVYNTEMSNLVKAMLTAGILTTCFALGSKT